VPAAAPSRALRIASWNVNGLRAAWPKGLAAYLDEGAATDELFALAVQEVRAPIEALPAEVRAHPTWWFAGVAAARKGYSGVGLFARREPDDLHEGLGISEFDQEGRTLIARWGRLVVISTYVPNGSGQQRDNSRVPYKLAYDEALRERADRSRRAGQRVVVLGDFNTAHRPIDLARPRENQGTSGFLPEERAALDGWFERGWIDSFREFEPGPGHYSWWAQRGGARERNVGWRIDYALVSPNLRPHLRGGFIAPAIRGSDHCPVGVELAPAALEATVRPRNRSQRDATDLL
jgi:exodeoxyribonuclease-3